MNVNGKNCHVNTVIVRKIYCNNDLQIASTFRLYRYGHMVEHCFIEYCLHQHQSLSSNSVPL